MDLYVEREENPISLQEWLDYVKMDEDLTLEEIAEGMNPITRERLRIEIPGRVVFGDEEIHYQKGCVGSDSDSKEVLAKLKQIAAKLQGDVYDCGEKED